MHKGFSAPILNEALHKKPALTIVLQTRRVPSIKSLCFFQATLYIRFSKTKSLHLMIKVHRVQTRKYQATVSCMLTISFKTSSYHLFSLIIGQVYSIVMILTDLHPRSYTAKIQHRLTTKLQRTIQIKLDRATAQIVLIYSCLTKYARKCQRELLLTKLRRSQSQSKSRNKKRFYRKLSLVFSITFSKNTITKIMAKIKRTKRMLVESSWRIKKVPHHPMAKKKNSIFRLSKEDSHEY